MMKKTYLLTAVLVTLLALLVAGCSNAITGPGEETAPAVPANYPAKNTLSNSIGTWKMVDRNIKNARDIAAFKKVYIISADGKTVYESSEDNTSFSPVFVTENVFAEDPAKTIAAGHHSVLSAGPAGAAVNLGVYVTTESNKIYWLIHRSVPNDKSYNFWQEVHSSYMGKAVAVTANNNKSKAWMVVDRYDEDYIMYTDFYTSTGWTRYTNNIFKDITAIDAGLGSRINPDVRENGLFVLCDDNTVYSLRDSLASKGVGYFHKQDTGHIVPAGDIAASPVKVGGFAVFQKNTTHCYYIKNGEVLSVGPARKISIAADGYLWDAYPGGIYKIKIH